MTAATMDFDTLQIDAEARLADLREERQRLAPEALRTRAAAGKLARVEEQIREAEQSIERVQLAQAETARREEQARRDADAERKAAALQSARELQAEREKAAREVDAALKQFATALAGWDRCTSEQESALRGAGWNAERAMQARPRSWMVECAIAWALQEAGCPHGIVGLSSLMGPGSLGSTRKRPLTEHDARPVEAEQAQTKQKEEGR